VGTSGTKTGRFVGWAATIPTTRHKILPSVCSRADPIPQTITKYNLLSYMENPISIDYILGEMKTLITEYKELKVKYKKYQIEQDFV
jgi:hypothetical protein